MHPNIPTGDPEGTEIIGQGNFLQLKRHPNGYEVAGRSGGCNAVSGIVYCPPDESKNETEGHYICILQYRIPVQQYVLELVAGLLDKPGKSPEQVMIEEVREETGMQVVQIEYCFTSPTSAGMTNELISLYWCQISHECMPQQLEKNERIRVVKILESRLESILAHRAARGKLTDSKVYLARSITEQRLHETLQK